MASWHDDLRHKYLKFLSVYSLPLLVCNLKKQLEAVYEDNLL